MTAINENTLNSFVESAMADMKGSVVVSLASLGDKLGLFKALVEAPLTSAELADNTGYEERYVREWLSAMACAGYVVYDARSGTFTLPPEHAQVLVNEQSPVFFGGLYQEMPALWRLLHKLANKFETGGGLTINDYDNDWWNGMERFTATWFENFLLQEWIPKANGIQERLQRGCHIADIGCGRGRALVRRHSRRSTEHSSPTAPICSSNSGLATASRRTSARLARCSMGGA